MLIKQQDGFVLPYVLLVIAVLSLAIIIAAQRIENISKLIAKIDDASKTELAFASAEAELTYTYLTAVSTIGGVNLNPSSQSALFDESDTDPSEADIWSAAGGIRISDTSNGLVTITYRDGTGYVPLNLRDAKSIEAVLTYLGATSDEAKNLRAKLFDYTDPDIRRQFRGAERADYRLRNLPPPTNSPLRKFEELNAVLDWKPFLNKISRQKVMEIATLNVSNTSIKRSFAEPRVMEALGLNFARAVSNAGLVGSDNFPTEVGRFVFNVETEQGTSSTRVIELEKTTGDLERPFNKFFVYSMVEENRQVRTDSMDKSGFKNVIHAETHRRR